MSEAEPGRRPWRNPWLLGLLGGIALVTILRPILVHRPEPPPARGPVPAFRFSDQQGREVTNASLAGRTWVAALHFGSGEDERGLDALLELQARYDRARVPVALVLVLPAAAEQPAEARRRVGLARGADFSRLSLVAGPPGAACDFASRAFREPLDAEPPGCAELARRGARARLLMVDGEGRSRGLYASDALGIDEVFHRSGHVLAEGRRARR